MPFTFINDLSEIDRTPYKVFRFYDRSMRVWTAYVINAAGDQISHAEHDYKKENISFKVYDYRLY